jgi:hypothetical protein
VKKLILAVLVLAFCSVCWGETPDSASVNRQPKPAALAQNDAAQAAPNSPSSPAACAFTFTSGAGDTFLKYCVTANGNVTEFQTPEGHEHIAVGAIGEGYSVCDFAFKPVQYFDYAEFGDSGNWGPAMVVSQNAKSVKIARTTSDGIWTLTQTFTQIAGSAPSVKIDMALKNNSDIAREAYLMRYADADADGSEINDMYTTANSAFAWNLRDPRTRSGFGLVLQGSPFTPDPRSGPFPMILFAGDGSDGAPCDPFPRAITELDPNDFLAFGMLYDIVVPAGRTKSVTVSYKGL